MHVSTEPELQKLHISKVTKPDRELINLAGTEHVRSMVGQIRVAEKYCAAIGPAAIYTCLNVDRLIFKATLCAQVYALSHKDRCPWACTHVSAHHMQATFPNAESAAVLTTIWYRCALFR